MLNLRSSARLFALGAALLTVGCDDDEDLVSPTPTARVRVVNLNPSVTSAGLFADGSAVGSTVSFGAASASCIAVPVGKALQFRAAGQSAQLVNVSNANITANQPYTIVLYGSAAAPQAAVLSDAGITAPSAGNAAIRFFNASGTAGDVYLNASGGALPGTPSAGNLLAGQATTGATAFGSYPSANTELRVYNVGNTTIPAINSTIITANLSTGRVGTVFLTNATATGGANASVTAAPCS